jgi:predicted ribosome quality control (RQC) complex YloA/Tae2 family protein
MIFMNERGTRFAVGRNASENEYITFKYMKERKRYSDVIWFHIEGDSGAHVVLIPDEMNDVNNDDIQEAADYAVSYSNKKQCWVCYCSINDVWKNKGDPIGTVQIKNEKRIIGYNTKKNIKI